MRNAVLGLLSGLVATCVCAQSEYGQPFTDATGTTWRCTVAGGECHILSVGPGVIIPDEFKRLVIDRG